MLGLCFFGGFIGLHRIWSGFIGFVKCLFSMFFLGFLKTKKNIQSGKTSLNKTKTPQIPISPHPYLTQPRYPLPNASLPRPGGVWTVMGPFCGDLPVTWENIAGAEREAFWEQSGGGKKWLLLAGFSSFFFGKRPFWDDVFFFLFKGTPRFVVVFAVGNAGIYWGKCSILLIW